MAVWKITFVSEHLNTDQSQLTKCFALVVAVLTIPASSVAGPNHAKRAKHIVDSHVLFHTRTHFH